MGESRNNPRSSQYRGPVRELPDALIRPDLRIEIAPSAAGLERIKAMTVPNGPPIKVTLPDEELDAVFFLCAQYVVPSRVDPERAPAATLRVKELFRMPLTELRARAGEAFVEAGMPNYAAPTATALKLVSD